MILLTILTVLLATATGVAIRLYQNQKYFQKELEKKDQLLEKIKEENVDALILVIDLREQLQHSTKTVNNATTIMKAQTDTIAQQKKMLQAQAHLIAVNDRILSQNSIKKHDGH